MTDVSPAHEARKGLLGSISGKAKEVAGAVLGNDYLAAEGQLQQAVSQNERLSATLREAREHIAALREEVEKLTMPPSAYGTFLGANDDGTVDIFTAEADPIPPGTTTTRSPGAGTAASSSARSPER